MNIFVLFNTALMLAEQRALLEEEKEAALAELREQLRIEKDQEVAETKKKQWVSDVTI